MQLPLADWLVILGDGSVKYQGTWAEVLHKPDNILKVYVTETHHNSTEEMPQVDKRLQSKSLQVAEATSDLRRATGDLLLYGNISMHACEVIY